MEDLLTSVLYASWNAVAQTLIWGIVLAGAVRFLLAVLTPAPNASTRFAVWFITLLAIAVMRLVQRLRV